MRILSLCLVVFSSLGWSFSAQASNGLLTMQTDNDVLFGTDSQYTGGLFFKLTQHKLKPVDFAISPLVRLFGHKNALNSSHQRTDQISAGGKIYTLQKTTPTGPQYFANTAWLYVDLKRFYTFPDHLYYFNMRLGWIGPSNHGEEIHNFVHQLIGNKKAKGWQHQLHDQPTFQIAIERQQTLYQSKSDHLHFYGYTSAMVGSPETNMLGGLGTYYAVGAHPMFSFNKLDYLSLGQKNTGWFVFANVSAMYDFYHLFRDGRLLTDDKPKVSFNNLLRTQLEYGGGLAYQSFSVTLSATVRDKTFKLEAQNRFRFASLIFTIPF